MIEKQITIKEIKDKLITFAPQIQNVFNGITRKWNWKKLSSWRSQRSHLPLQTQAVILLIQTRAPLSFATQPVRAWLPSTAYIATQQVWHSSDRVSTSDSMLRQRGRHVPSTPIVRSSPSARKTTAWPPSASRAMLRLLSSLQCMLLTIRIAGHSSLASP